ncbi:MAG TPA: class II glutamine amidotransferase [Candidatus Dormibacteraeota bacterium]|nr:class II glutamine amidotransferase [Candidatus Dormibacteraeota bacterium]
MCEILAVATTEPLEGRTVLEWAGPLERHGESGYGWGVAWLEDGRLQHYRAPSRMADDPAGRERVAAVRSTRYLLHLRRPSALLTVSLADSQPFLGDGGDRAFAHNGRFIHDADWRDRYARALRGAADSEVGFHCYLERRDAGATALDALRQTHERLGGVANLGALDATGELAVYGGNRDNAFWRFRLGEAAVASTALHSEDDALFVLVFPAAVAPERVTAAGVRVGEGAAAGADQARGAPGG